MRIRSLPLVEALGLAQGPELIAIVGGGGKSSLLFALGQRLPGRVILTTTTRIFAAQIALADASCSVEDPDFAALVSKPAGTLLVTGGIEGERAKGVPADLPSRFLERGVCDWVVAEADGSRMRPTKAPADHEPVVPIGTSLLVAVAGIDALEGPIRERAHRPEHVCGLTGLSSNDVLEPRALGALLTSPRGGRKGVGPDTRFVVFINKVEGRSRWNAAREVAAAALEKRGVSAVVLGALQGGDRFEVHTRADRAQTVTE